MSSFGLYVLQVNSYLILLLIGFKLLLKRSNHFYFNRAYLLLIPVIALTLPLVNFSVVEVAVNPSKIYEVFIPETTALNMTTATSLLKLKYLLLITYALGFLIGFISLVVSSLRINRLKLQNSFNGKYYELKGSTNAFSFMNSIFIGNELSNIDQEIAYYHELIHQQRLHSYDLIYSRICVLLFWFNPFVYRLPYYLKIQHEYEADFASCTDSEKYILLLLKQQFNISSLPLGHHFNANTNLKSRIMRIKDQSKMTISIKSIAIIVIFTAIGFIGIQSLKATNPTMPTYEATTESAIQDSVIIAPDVMPVFNKDKMGIQKFIAENIVYPAEAKEQKITGRVFISFVVGLKGKVEDVKILKGAHPLLDQAALDVINKLPKFKSPGMQDGKVVRVQFNTPINFTLANK